MARVGGALGRVDVCAASSCSNSIACTASSVVERKVAGMPCPVSHSSDCRPLPPWLAVHRCDLSSRQPSVQSASLSTEQRCIFICNERTTACMQPRRRNTPTHTVHHSLTRSGNRGHSVVVYFNFRFPSRLHTSVSYSMCDALLPVQQCSGTFC